MLRTIRKSASGVGAYIIVGLFILAFAVVGVPALNNFGRGDAVTVGDTGFSAQTVERELARRVENYRAETGTVLSREEAVSQGLLQNTINYFGIRGLFQEEAADLGLSVPNKLIQQYLQSDERLQNPETGRFDRTVLGRILDANRYSLEEFKRAISDELIQTQMNDALALGGPAPKQLAELIALRQTEERVVNTATLIPSAAEDVSEEALLSFYAANAPRYATPDRRQYTLVTLDRETLEARITVPEEDVQKLFEARAAMLGTPETRTFSQALFPTAEAAQAVREQITAGSSFADAVDAVGIAVTNVTDQPQTGLADDAVADAIFGAELGLVGPIDGDFGVVLAELQTITPGVQADFETLKEELQADLFDEMYREEIDILYDELQAAGDAGASLSQIAADLNLPVRTVGPVDADMITADGAIEDGVPLKVHQAAFAMNADGLFETVDIADSGYAFIEVEAALPGTTLPYEEVADRVAADFEADRTTQALAELADQFRAQIDEGLSFEETAAAMGSEAVTRNIGAAVPPADLPPIMFNEIFGANLGDVVSATNLAGNGIVVAQTQSLSFGPNGQLSNSTDQLRMALGQNMSREYYDAYVIAMQAAHETTQNDTLLNARLGVDQ